MVSLVHTHYAAFSFSLENKMNMHIGREIGEVESQATQRRMHEPGQI